jgi:hypothetical protein
VTRAITGFKNLLFGNGAVQDNIFQTSSSHIFQTHFITYILIRLHRIIRQSLSGGVRLLILF